MKHEDLVEGVEVEEYWVDGLADVPLPGEVPLEVRPDQLIVRDSRIFHATGLNTSKEGRLMSHWLFRDGACDDHRFRFEDVLTADLINALSPEQRDALWLGREFEIAEAYREERERATSASIASSSFQHSLFLFMFQQTTLITATASYKLNASCMCRFIYASKYPRRCSVSP